MDKESLMKGLKAALFLNLLFAFAMYGVNKTASIMAFAVSFGIYFYYRHLIERKG